MDREFPPSCDMGRGQELPRIVLCQHRKHQQEAQEAKSLLSGVPCSDPRDGQLERGEWGLEQGSKQVSGVGVTVHGQVHIL